MTRSSVIVCRTAATQNSPPPPAHLLTNEPTVGVHGLPGSRGSGAGPPARSVACRCPRLRLVRRCRRIATLVLMNTVGPPHLAGGRAYWAIRGEIVVDERRPAGGMRVRLVGGRCCGCASTSSSAPAVEGLSLVAIGDSIPDAASNCPGCIGFVDQYDAAIAKATDQKVRPTNLSESTGLTLPGP